MMSKHAGEIGSLPMPQRTADTAAAVLRLSQQPAQCLVGAISGTRHVGVQTLP